MLGSSSQWRNSVHLFHNKYSEKKSINTKKKHLENTENCAFKCLSSDYSEHFSVDAEYR